MWRLLSERIRILWHFCSHRFGRRFRSRKALERWQNRRLDRLLKFLNQRSEFYHLRLAQPWTATPPIDKAIMMSSFDQLNTRGLLRDQSLELALKCEQSRDFSPMIGDITVGLSSGTSGHRGLFCADFQERTAYAGAILAKALPSGGLLRKHRVAFFLRANSNLYKTVQSRRLAFHFFDLLQPLAEHIAQLTRINPTLLIGPPSLLRQLAQSILKGDLELPNVERVYSVAEVLDPVDEVYIRHAFGQKVHQIYQCTEGFLGISCAHGSLHLNEDMVIFEKEWIDRSSGKFVPILTDLNRRTQPIVRYRLNDILTEDFEPCPCGSVMTRIKMIEGRCDDMLEFRRGKTKHLVFPDFIRNAILFAADEINEYRVTQLPTDELVIALRGKGPVERLELKVSQQLSLLAQKLNCDAPVIVYRHEFPSLNGSKLRRVIRQQPVAHPP